MLSGSESAVNHVSKARLRVAEAIGVDSSSISRMTNNQYSGNTHTRKMSKTQKMFNQIINPSNFHALNNFGFAIESNPNFEIEGSSFKNHNFETHQVEDVKINMNSVPNLLGYSSSLANQQQYGSPLVETLNMLQKSIPRAESP